jgi:RNA polymerase sigma-70 factor (ECF subfamily)
MLIDEEVIERARKGDAEAFTQIVVAYKRRISGTISRLIGRPEDVEDVVQEVFVRLYQSLDQLRSPQVFEPWLQRLSINAAYDYHRRNRRRKESRMADLSEQQVMLADAGAGSERARDDRNANKIREFMQSLLGHLSAEDRLLLLMKEVEGLSLKELADVYKVSESALKVRLFRARQRVLKVFRANPDGERI